MYITTKRVWILKNADRSLSGVVPPLPIGRHQMERLSSPAGGGGDWLVLKGTVRGMPESTWKDYVSSSDNWQIVIEE